MPCMFIDAYYGTIIDCNMGALQCTIYEGCPICLELIALQIRFFIMQGWYFSSTALSWTPLDKQNFKTKYFVFKKIRNVDAKSVIIETEEDELLQEETISVRKKSDKKGKKIRLVE